MSQFLYPNAGAMFLAGVVQSALAGAKVRLFTKTVVLGPGTTQAQLVAAESAFSGYAAKTVTAFTPPYIATSGGASISTGYLQWDWTTPTPPTAPVSENVQGFWVEDSTGKLLVAGTFDTPVAMAGVGNSLPLTVTLNYGQTA